jgi:hexokinase
VSVRRPLSASRFNSKRFADPDCQIGLILGTGTNAAYVESKAAIPKLGSGAGDSGGKGSDSMVVNMEWGNFRHESLRMTAYDHTIHANSSTTGQVRASDCSTWLACFHQLRLTHLRYLTGRLTVPLHVL